MAEADSSPDGARLPDAKPTRGTRIGASLPLDPPPVPPSSHIGRFEVRDILGEGAFGRVYLGFDPELERQVAIKVPKPEGLTRELRDRFVREARATARIHHPNVCPVYEVGTDGDLPYIVMHYLAGTTLAAHLDETGALSPQQAVALAQRLALGVAAAHAEGVIHRDLKPQNILFDPRRKLVLITDFGLAHFGNQAHTTVAGSVFGTPAYMSPEQARGKVNEVGEHSDVYSLGIILFRMLTGQLPFNGTVYEILFQHSETPPPQPSALRRGLDPRLDGLVLKALAKAPADRYASAKEFARFLGEFHRAGEPTAWVSAETTHTDPPPDPVPSAAPPRSQSSAPGSSGARRTGPPPLPASAVHKPVLPLSLLYADEAPERGSRKKKLLLFAGLVFVACVVAVAGVVFANRKKPLETVTPAQPGSTPGVSDDPKLPEMVPPVVPSKVPDPPKPLPSIANGFVGHVFDQDVERRAALWVLSGGGTVSVTPIEPPLKNGSSFTKNIAPASHLRPVAKADDLPDAFTVAFIEFEHKSNVTGSAIATNLVGLSGPVRCTFRECAQLNDEAVTALARVPKLTHLNLIKTPNVTDSGIAALAGHPALERLTLVRTNATRAAMKDVATLSALTALELDVPAADEWLGDLAKLHNLMDLTLNAYEAEDLSLRGLTHLKAFTKLRHLGLNGRKITDDWLPWLAALGTLERLDLSNARLEGPGLATLKKLPHLKALGLEDAFVRDEALAHVADYEHLEILDLTGTNVGDDGVRALTKSKSLKKIILTNSRVTATGVRELKTKLPKCIVVNF